MKKVRTPDQRRAAAAARTRGLFVAAIALVVGIIMLMLSNYFLQMHCVMALALTLSGGIAAARAAMWIDRDSALAAGRTGGLYAGLAYALPFVIFNFSQYVNINAQTLNQRIAQLSAEQISQIEQNNIQLGIEFFKGQDIAYVFGYLLFALLFGALFGSIGGALARRQMGE